MRHALEPTPDAAWIMEENWYDPLRECCSESRFSVGNGLLGVRGARAVSRGPMWLSWMHSLHWASWPRTYIAGLFDTPNIEPPVPALVPAADWLRVHIHLNGKLLVLRSSQLLSHRRILDMHRGVLIIDWCQRDPDVGVVRVRTLRLVSQAERAVGLQLLTFELDEREAAVTLEAECDTAGVGLEAVRLEQDLGVWRSEQSGVDLAMASAASLQLDGTELLPSERTPLKSTWHWTAIPGHIASLARLMTVARGAGPMAQPDAAGREELARVQRVGWRSVLAAHEGAWAERWRCSDIEIEGDAVAQQALRFAAYHLNSAANPADERVSIGARALTGDAYLGHVFWDTEIFLLPFYTMTWPEAARALLMYRYHTLDGARAKAARMGWRGALYAWESADTGEETTPRQVIGVDGRAVDILCGELEQHISADVAFAVWQYWQVTGDEGFLRNAGAEILLETARFWASRAELEPDSHRHIRDVIGPDEYHEHVDDNAYTNVMARWNIRRGLEIANLLRERWPQQWAALAARLCLGDTELVQWREVADTLVTGHDVSTGLYAQFAGFFGLEDIDLAKYAGRTVAMDVALGRETTKRSQVLKQADVVALLALLPDEFDFSAKATNFHYYEPRCAHDSSLSRPMHALAAARLGDTDGAFRYFRETAATDLADTAGVSAGGVHIAALGGLWQVAILGFAGVSVQAGGLSLDPQLPTEWRSLAFSLQWRGRRLKIRIERPGATVHIVLEAGEVCSILIYGEQHKLCPGRTVSARVAPEVQLTARSCGKAISIAVKRTHQSPSR
jgi:trehalose/maltose hydrolase-like predicted phosphorylase